MVMTKAQLSALAKRAKLGFERTKKGRAGFLAGTFQLAQALAAARKEFSADREFASWLNKAGLRTISKDDRSALICIGKNIAKARKYFKAHDVSWSWRLCADALSASTVSQIAKPTTLNLTIVKPEPAKLSYSLKVVRPEPTKLAYSLDINSPDVKLLRQQPTQEPPIVEGLPEAIIAIESVIRASSLATDVVATYWQADDRNRSSSDQVREAGHWLDALADALETTRYHH
jgi:hypothetical protein